MPAKSAHPSSDTSETRSISSVHSIGLDGAPLASGPNRMQDVAQIAFLCRQHRAMLLAKVPDSGELLYFPFTVLKSGEPPSAAQHSKTKELLSALSLNKANIGEAALVELFRIEIPPNKEFIIRYTFRIEAKDGLCVCNGLKSPKDTLVWVKFEESQSLKKCILTQPGLLWAVEPALMLDKILNSPHYKDELLQETLLSDVCKYLSEENKTKKNELSLLLAKHNFDKEMIYKMYLEFLNYTYPSLYMSLASFNEFVSKYQYSPHYDNKTLLLAFQIDDEKRESNSTLGVYIEFDELLWGLLFTDRDCPHKAPFAEVRNYYTFNYYTKRSTKETLSREELLKMATDTDQINALSGQKKTCEAEVDIFLKEGTSKRPKNSITFKEFHSTAEKLTSSSCKQHLKFLNFDLMMRSLKPLSQSFDRLEILNRGINLGKDMLDIVRKREDVCLGCINKEPSKFSEHSVKVFYSGAVTEVWDNQQWIGELKREKDRMKRSASNSLFIDNFFPNQLYEAIAGYLDNGNVRTAAISTKQKSPTKRTASINANNKSLTKWSEKFVQKYTKEIMDIIEKTSKVGQAEGELLRVRAPVAIVNVIKGTELVAIERNISHLQTFMFPVCYVYMLNWSELSHRGFESILLLVACKALLPQKFYLLVGKNDPKKRDVVQSVLLRQCESYLGGEWKEKAVKMVESLMNLLEAMPKMALIDEAVFVVPGVNHVGNAYENLREMLPFGDGDAEADVAIGGANSASRIEQSSITAGTSPAKNKRKKKKRKKKARPSFQSVRKETLKGKSANTPSSTPSSVSWTVASEVTVSPSGTGGAHNVPTADTCHVLYTTNATTEPKLVFVSTPGDRTGEGTVALGLEKCMPPVVKGMDRFLVVLVEDNKIRPLYLLAKAKQQQQTIKK